MTRSEQIGAAWPGFIRYLSTLPRPGGVMEALVRGPLATYGARAAGLHRREGDWLVLIDQYGSDGPQVSRGQIVPLVLDMPITIACRHNELIAVSVRDAIKQYSAMAVDADIWTRLAEQTDDGSLVAAPVVSGGRCVAVYSFIFTGPPDFDAFDYSSCTAIGALLGLWLTHPMTGAEPTNPPEFRRDSVPLVLSARQISILEMVASGRANPAIAAKLGYSLSTVKQELSRIMDILRVTNRHDAVHKARVLELMGSDGEIVTAGR